jgi:glycosyltransferase involved in cell wall biosynthesis
MLALKYLEFIPIMKKICFITTTPLIVNFFLKEHIKVLSQEFEIYLIINHSDEELTSLKKLNLTNIFYLPIAREINIIQDVKALIKLYSYLKKFKFDAVHSVSPKAGLLSSIAGWFAGIKNRIHIFTGQTWASKKGFYRYFLKTFDKIIVLFSTTILIDGKSQRSFLINEGIVKTENSLILGEGSISGVDLKRFKASLEVRNTLRKGLIINDSTIVFLFLGRIKEDKGILDLVKAFKKLTDEKKDVFLLLVGYDEEDLVKQISSILIDNDRFFYFGSTSSPEDILPIADVFCLPSYREGFGTSIIEASSCKLPIICSDIYGLTDAVIENQTGLKHSVGNIDSLYKQMLRLASDKELREILGNNGYKYVCKHFSTEIISGEWLTFYRNLLNENNGS